MPESHNYDIPEELKEQFEKEYNLNYEPANSEQLTAAYIAKIKAISKPEAETSYKELDKRVTKLEDKLKPVVRKGLIKLPTDDEVFMYGKKI